MLKRHTNSWHFLLSGPDLPLFSDHDGQRSRTQWLADVASAVAFCQRQQGGRVLLYHQDLYQFSCWFFALQHTGFHIILPPNGQPDVLSEVASCCDWMAPTLELTQVTAEPLSIQLPADGLVSFFTSGSEGKPKRVDKRLHQLLCEVEQLEQVFGSRLSSHCWFAGTVSHQHIYGLLFRLLWPLASGRPIYTQVLAYLEEWQALLAKGPLALVASPAHLSRFDDLALHKEHASHSHAVFSSGGPLPEWVPLMYQKALADVPIEIYGSTETGGIAYRQRYYKATPWQTFPGLRLEQSATSIALYSPYLTEQPYILQDQLQLLGPGQFQLLGRTDRIVKLEEKRLALAEMEQFCGQHPYVRQVIALLLNEPRAKLALVVVLNETGQQQLRAYGKRALNQQLKMHLVQRFERVLLPRRLRYLDALPYNEQGKLPKQRLEALFTNDNTISD